MNIHHNGKDLELLQEPCLSGVKGKEFYEARAIDNERNEYIITWALLPDYDPQTNDEEGDACDWDCYTVAKIYQKHEIDSIAASLYDGGWRSDDREGLIYEYGMTDEVVEAITEKLAEYEEKNINT